MMYVRATISLLVVAALIAGTAGCVTAVCDLTVASAPGGSVSAPGNGTSAYAQGDVVDLIAIPDSGYRFVNWTGNVGTVADVNSAETTVIMNGSYTITANFDEIPPHRYNLTVASTAGGSVTMPGEGTFAYDPGTVISLVATPADGYEFSAWSGDVIGVADVNSASTTITADGDYVISAGFEEILPERYSLTVSSSAGGSVTAPGEGAFTYDEGEVVNLTVEAEEGYRFVRWSGDTATLENAEATFTAVTMYGHYSVTASFEPIPAVRHDLTVASTGGGVVVTPGKGTFGYDEGTVVNLAASPASGYEFVNWTGDVATVENVNASSTTITMNGSYSIRANFEPIASAWYYLSIGSTAGGSVTTPGEGNYVCSAGMVVTLIATPAAGYEFVNWTGDVGTMGNVNASSTTITMNGSYSIRANFEQISSGQFGLTTSSTTGGSVTLPGEGAFTYEAGTAVSLTATPAAGYEFVNWTGDVDTMGNVNVASTTITMSGSYSIRANFEQVSSGQFGLTTSSTTGGSVTLPGEGTFTYEAGTVVSLTATPAAGYDFVNWTGDVGTIGNVNAASTTITMNGSYSIRANFEQVSSGQFGLTTSSTTGGSVTLPGEGTSTYEAGTVVSLTATPASGYEFVNWTGDVGTMGNVNAASTTITMNGSYAIRANFFAESSSPPGIDYTTADAEALIIELVNNERQSYGLSALSEDALLTSLAREHSISMVENGFFGHERYPGERPFNYGQQPGTIRGENLAKIPTRRTVPGPYLSLQEVCEWAVSAWMGSPGHRANILEPRYAKTGVGVAFSQDGNYLYITQMFEGPYS